jgi:outer membrane protein TolC
MALESNRDLRVSVLNVAAAEALYRSTRGGLFPTFGASGGADYAQTPADLGSGVFTGSTAPVTSRSFSASLGFTAYELDLFGRARSQSRSASLTGSYGTAAASFSRLFGGGSETWSFSPSITLPIFTGGSNQANLDYARLQQRIEIANYERAIRTAFREVADALAARGSYGDQLNAQRALAEAYADSYRLSELRFRSGVDNFPTVLDSQRELYGAQQALITLQRDQLANRVTLFKVLGGGWR